MYGKMEKSREAVLQFLRSSNPEDEFFLVAFNDRPELLVDFTSSIDEVQDEISKVKPDGRTALLDALYLGLERIKKACNERTVLLVISDGGDNHSRYTAKEVWPVLREADVQIYAMGIFDEAPRTQAERLGPDLLAFATGITGGRTFPIRNLKRVGDAAAELSIELRNQYLVAYRPNNLAHDGMWHKLTVRVTPPQNLPRLRVYEKAGYYASAQ
jgi:Ca-activated chloride channel family protein